MSMVYQSCSRARHGASPSVLRMILICCNHVLNLTGDFRGGAGTLSNQMFRGGHPVFQGGPGPLGPLRIVIRPLFRSVTDGIANCYINVVRCTHVWIQNLASKILCVFVTGGAYAPTPLVCLRHCNRGRFIFTQWRILQSVNRKRRNYQITILHHSVGNCKQQSDWFTNRVCGIWIKET